MMCRIYQQQGTLSVHCVALCPEKQFFCVDLSYDGIGDSTDSFEVAFIRMKFLNYLM